MADRLRTPSQPLVILAIALAFLVLFPPVVLDGKYSVLEVALALVCATLLINLRRSPAIRFTAVPTPLIGLLAIMFLSALWSYASWDTLRDATTFALLALAALLITQTAELNTVMLGVVAGGMLALLWSLLWVVVHPEAGYYPSGAIQGIYGNRNGFGYVMLQWLPAALVLRFRFPGGIAVKAIVILAVCGAIVASTSVTSIVMLALVLIAWLALALVRRSWIYGAVIGAIVVVGVIVAFMNFDRTLEIVGKSASLNGRAKIWNAVLSVVPDSPLVGFGWSRSWQPGSPHSSAVAQSLGGHIVFHAHDEALNWLVTTGVIGLLLVTGLYAFVLWAGILVFRARSTPGAPWILLTAIMLIGRGVTEISETSAQGWFILMLIVFAAARYLPSSVKRRPPHWILPAGRRDRPPRTQEPHDQGMVVST